MDDDLRLGPIDFFSSDSQALLNPRMPSGQAERLTGWLSVAKTLKAQVFILTSGSTATSEADHKWVALPKAAILSAAAGSNSHFGSTSEDIWLHCLPDFHVGGIGIWARAFLARSKVASMDLQEGWNARRFQETVLREGATLTSLVPAQVHDLATQRLESPRSLRAVLVGGGALSDGVYLAARDLGWPILRTYGMSEAASQVATEPLSDLDRRATGADVNYQVLPHLEAKASERGQLCVRGASLLSGYVSLDAKGKPRFWDPKDANGWFTTEDLGSVEGRKLTMHGRTNDRIKIGGEIANLALLRETLASQLSEHENPAAFALVAVPDARLESVIALVTEGEPAVESLIERFNAQVMPFERIRQRYSVRQIPRSELGKVKWAELLALLPKP